jgi:hypothetical protein
MYSKAAIRYCTSAFSQLSTYFIRKLSLSSELCRAGSLLQTGCKIRITFLSDVDLLMGWAGHLVRVGDRSAYGFW